MVPPLFRYLSGGYLKLDANRNKWLFTTPPSLTDAATGLGRAARFAGQTNHWWSVLHHTYAGYVAMRGERRPLAGIAVRSWLTHDAHEAYTSDIPSPFCSPSIRELQSDIDDGFMAEFEYWPKTKGAEKHPAVADMDSRMLRAEAYALCPPLSPVEFAVAYGAMPNMDDVKIVNAVQRMYGTGLSSTEGWNSPLVRWWVGRMRQSLALPGAWAATDDEELMLVKREMEKGNSAYGDLYEEEDE